jgi:hypothetical protein
VLAAFFGLGVMEIIDYNDLKVNKLSLNADQTD